MKKLLFITLLLVFGSTLSVNAQGATLQDLQTQIQALLSQIAQLQAQLNQVQGGTVPPAFCYNFQNSLRLGDTGSDVRALQQALKEQSLYFGNITGSFDVSIFQATVLFQEKYQREILAPFSITRGTGFVGRTTKAQLNKLYQCGIPRSTPVPTPGIFPSPIPTPQPGLPSITIISPNGGEVWTAGNTYDITWTSQGVEKVVLLLIAGNGAEGWFLAFNIPTSNIGKFTWKVANNPGTEYRIQIWDSQDTSVGDFSDNFFSIVSATTTTPSITVLSPNGGEVWKIGEVRTIRWSAPILSSQNVKKGVKLSICYTQIGLGDICRPLTGNFADTFSASLGQYQWVVNSNIYKPGSGVGDPKIKVTDAADATIYDESDNFFSIVSATTTVITACDSYGDVNLDGVVNILDVTLVNQYIANLTTLTAEQLLRADVDQDGSVTSTDVTYILEFITGTRSSFPACEKTPPCASYGDVNNNGIVNLRDVDLILKYTTGTSSLTAEQQKRADVSGDGAVNIFDVISVKQYAGGTSTTFSACYIGF